MSDFPKCCTFVRPLYGWLNRPLLIIVHGQCLWTIHGSLWAMCCKITGWSSLYISSSKGNTTRQLLSGARRFTNTIASIAFLNSVATCHSLNGWCRFVVYTSPRVIPWVGDVTSLSPLLGPIYIGTFFLLPLTSLIISFLPTRPRASSSFLPSFQVFPLPS